MLHLQEPSTQLPSVLLVNDNSDIENVGCRATSAALYTMLSTKFTIKDVVKKRTADIPLIVPHRRIATSRICRRIIKFTPFGKRWIKDWITESIDNNTHLLLSRQPVHPELARLRSKIQSAEIVVINGEGSAIFRTNPRRDLLFQLTIAAAAKKLRKLVFYVNAMISDPASETPNHTTQREFYDILAECDGVSLRDPDSFHAARSVGKLDNIVEIPDALFGWLRFHESVKKHLRCAPWLAPMGEETRHVDAKFFNDPYIIVSGSSLSVENEAKCRLSFGNLVHALKNSGMRIILLPTCSRDVGFLNAVSKTCDVPILPITTPVFAIGAVISDADFFISGRYHPSIFAALGGVPSVFLQSNSHKTRSIQRLLKYSEVIEYSAHPTMREIDEIKDRLVGGEFGSTEQRNAIRHRASELASRAWELPEFVARNTGASVRR